MHKISIDNLFNVTPTPLTIESLYNPQNKKINELNVDSLLQVHKNRKKKVLEEYDKIYNMCSKRIIKANSLNKTEIIYDVPLARFMSPGYDSLECLYKLEEKLEKLFMDTLILSSTSIFISWKDIEHNRNKKT